MERPIEPPLPPTALAALQEGLGLLEVPRLLLRAPELLAQPRGSGEPVLVLPGYGTGDASTALLRAYLGFLGYRALGWGRGRNRGEVAAVLPALGDLVARLAEQAGRRVHLIGWSLGGFLAREVARDAPERVEGVITLGSPVVGGPKYTAVAEVYRRRGHDLDAIEAEVAARALRVPLSVPVTAVYSRTDRVVAWRACVDRQGANVEHVEVRTTHLGLGFSAEVWRVIARSLARRHHARAGAAVP